MSAHDARSGLLFDVVKNSVLPPERNQFDRDEPWIMLLFTGVFVICGVASGYATFAGIRLFLQEVGDAGMLADGTAIIMTIAICSILTVGWSVLCRYGPEARTPFLKACMVKLGVALFAITLCVSSLPNVMALAGPAAKLYDWRHSLAGYSLVLNQLETRSLGVVSIRPGWLAERAKACQLEKDEVETGRVSTSGRGVGPVAVALSGVCSQTSSFIEAMDAAVAQTTEATEQGRAALTLMRDAIRDRGSAVIDREDRFLAAGDLLNAALQQVRAADLSRALDAGAAQVGAGVAELGRNSAFTPQQVEMVSAIRTGLQGLVDGTRTISDRLAETPVPETLPIRSPDFLEAILTHGHRFVPIVAAAVGIDAFTIWSLAFLLTGKAGKVSRRLRGDFERLIDTDTLAPLDALAPPPSRRPPFWRSLFRRRDGLS